MLACTEIIKLINDAQKAFDPLTNPKSHALVID